MKKVTVLILFFLIVVLSSCKTQPAQLYTLNLNGHELQVEVADNDRERETGLMNRQNLPADHGMLFVFDDSEPRAFWMHNTYIDLSIAYIDENGRIIDIKDMYALDDSSVRSSGPAKYALEVNQGVFDRYGLYTGDVIDLSGIPGR